MKSKLIMLVGALALSGALAAQATSITGEVDMSGTAMLNSTSLGSASSATAFSSVTVGGTPSGSFTGTAGDTVTWNSFSWPGGSASPLWTFADGTTGYTYSFDLANDSVVTQDNTFLNLIGTGTLFITGTGSPYDAAGTTGSWSFTISNPTGGTHSSFNFTFANSQTAVPDGGMTVMLLGAALSAMGLLRRKLMA